MVKTDAVTLGEELALSAHDLAKRQTNVHERRYTPTDSIVSLLRSRRNGTRLPSSPYDGGGVDDDDDDDDDEFGEETPALEEAIRSEWALRGVSFTVARGQAVALIGDEESVAAVAQILARVTAPTSGDVVHRGRIGLSSELAKAMARRELRDTRGALRILAPVAGVPRDQRKLWIREVFAMATGDAGGGTPDGSVDRIRRRMPYAVCLDPTADILVIDVAPPPADTVFCARWLERLRQRLAEGAAAVIASDDVELIGAVCSEALWLKDGLIERRGPALQLVEELQQSRRDAKNAASAPPAFNAQVAIISAALTTADGRPTHDLRRSEEPLRILVRFETAQPDTTVIWRVRMTGVEPLVLEQRKPMTVDLPGAYLITLRLPARSYDEGDYELAVEAVVSRPGGHDRVARTLAGSYRASEPALAADALVDIDSLAVEWAPLDDRSLLDR